MSDPKTRYERGLDVCQTLTGSEEAGRALVEHFESQGALGSFALHTGAGEIWSRSELARRDRSLVVISFLTALGRELELPAHIAGGLNHGLGRDEIDEIMVQMSAYAGTPFALSGARIAAQVFAQQDGTEQRTTPPAPAKQKDPEKRRADGLDVLRGLWAGVADVLVPGGVAAFELSSEQVPAVSDGLRDAGLADVKCFRDFEDRPRVVAGRKPAVSAGGV